jgi:DNA gyrase/topoisomerase IV subunit A
MALDSDGKPVMFNLKDYLQAYIAHNIECLVKEYIWELEKA